MPLLAQEGHRQGLGAAGRDATMRPMSLRIIGGRPRRAKAIACARAVLALSLLLGFLPRVLDHHWAERLPWHAHLTFDDEPGHRHSFDGPHGHDGSGVPDGGMHTPGRAVVAYHEGGTSSALALGLPFLSEEPTWPGAPLSRLATTSGDAARAAGIVPGVLHPPPISALFLLVAG